MRISLIIPAGGSSSRFQKGIQAIQASKISANHKPQCSKIFVDLVGQPLIAYVLEAFQTFPEIKETIIAVPKGSEVFVRALIRREKWKNVHVTRGGKTRALSVERALEKTNPKNTWVMVHDGARPFVPLNAVRKMLKSKKENVGGMIIAKRVIPTIKQVERSWKISGTIDRESLCEAETPQLIKRNLLFKAFRSVSGAEQFTDEASLLEAMNEPVSVVIHDGWNPKVTTFQDYELANALLRSQKAKAVTALRIGMGKDIHRLVPKRKFLLGGVRIPHNLGPLGHSDGDALIHAIIDAVLGACSMGDIGDWFSDKNPRFKNIASGKMLQIVMQEVQKKGWTVQHLDTIIFLERPKLGIYKKKIHENISKIMKLSREVVSIKAKTMEGFGPIGNGEAVSCEALVTLVKS